MTNPTNVEVALDLGDGQRLEELEGGVGKTHLVMGTVHKPGDMPPSTQIFKDGGPQSLGSTTWAEDHCEGNA